LILQVSQVPWADNVPAIKSKSGHAARRAKRSAQARPAMCFGPCRARLGSEPCYARVRPNHCALGHAFGSRAACSTLTIHTNPGCPANVEHPLIRLNQN